MARRPPPKVFVTCDVVLMTLRESALQVLLIRRRNPPFQGRWALPGGFVELEETLHASALRELEEETGIRDIYSEQLYTFGDPGRDPRGRTVTVAYMALAPESALRPKAGSDARETRWFEVDPPPVMAFDHGLVLRTAVRRLRAKLGYSTVAAHLLPPRFTLSELQGVYETILGRPLDKRNFRRKMLSLGLLRPRREREARRAHRPAQLYSFRSREVVIVEGLVKL